MIAVRLTEDVNAVEEVKQWLLAAPRGAVEFEGIMPSYSSILLVATPVVIWDMLPPCSAVSFLGFIRGPGGAEPTTQPPDVRSFIPVLGHNRIQAAPVPRKDTSLGDFEVRLDVSPPLTRALLENPGTILICGTTDKGARREGIEFGS